MSEDVFEDVFADVVPVPRESNINDIGDHYINWQENRILDGTGYLISGARIDNLRIGVDYATSISDVRSTVGVGHYATAISNPDLSAQIREIHDHVEELHRIVAQQSELLESISVFLRLEQANRRGRP